MSRQDSAETLALQALSWLAGNEELLPVFLGATGASLNEMATRASDGAYLASVLDFLLMDDAWIVAFCDDQGLPYQAPLQARAWLPGGEAEQWQ